MLAVTHNLFLIMASIAVSLVAAFTGLAITNNIASLPDAKRKTLVVMSSFILGGGIWSMHFVAMLAHEFSVPIYYDSLQTLGSALVAILVAGAALLMLHFSVRTQRQLNLAGIALGGGVIVMHYVGMYAIRGIIPQFTFISVVMAVLVAAVAGVIAIRVAYGERTKQNIVLGASVFGFAVAAVHYAAMLGTSFRIDDAFQVVPIVMANHTLAVTVTLASFVICGAFLLTTTNFLTQSVAVVVPKVAPLKASDETSGLVTSSDLATSASQTEAVLVDPAAQSAEQSAVPVEPKLATSAEASIKIPYEKNKKIEFLELDDVAAARADGHYTQLFTRTGVHFCPWSISEADKKLSAHGFHRTHRSYLVNVSAVDSFEKRKETGACLFKNFPGLASVPVSRNRVIGLTQVLKQQPFGKLKQTS